MKHILARKLLVAVPPKVLDRIDWRAEQDRWIGAQADLFCGGMMIKVTLRYDHPFWLDRGLGLIGQFIDPKGMSVFDSSDAAGGFDTLTVFIGGSTARSWSPLPPEERWSLMMGHLEAMLGPDVRTPLTVMEADWTGHPWCGGGYNSWPRPWTNVDPIRRLQDAQDGMTFAGAEIAQTYSGYVEGALRSGRLAATRLFGTDADE
jgi:monoamine oxidase